MDNRVGKNRGDHLGQWCKEKLRLLKDICVQENYGSGSEVFDIAQLECCWYRSFRDANSNSNSFFLPRACNVKRSIYAKYELE